MCAVENSKNAGDRGVSEVIGFLLIFTIIIAGIGLVTLYGYPMLLQQQSSANERIMEKNLIVLQNDLKSLAYNMVPYSETSLDVEGGTLTVYNMSYSPSSSFTISDTLGSINPPVTFQPGDLRYESPSAQTGISLENGAVVMRMFAQSGSSMLAHPRWFYDGPTSKAVIYLIGFNSTNIMAQSGVGGVAMQLNQIQTNYTIYSIPSGDTVKVQYTPNPNANYSAAWGNYFTNTGWMTSLGNWQYKYTQTPTTLVVYRYNIIVNSV